MEHQVVLHNATLLLLPANAEAPQDATSTGLAPAARPAPGPAPAAAVRLLRWARRGRRLFLSVEPIRNERVARDRLGRSSLPLAGAVEIVRHGGRRRAPIHVGQGRSALRHHGAGIEPPAAAEQPAEETPGTRAGAHDVPRTAAPGDRRCGGRILRRPDADPHAAPGLPVGGRDAAAAAAAERSAQ